MKINPNLTLIELLELVDNQQSTRRDELTNGTSIEARVLAIAKGVSQEPGSKIEPILKESSLPKYDSISKRADQKVYSKILQEGQLIGLDALDSSVYTPLVNHLTGSARSTSSNEINSTMLDSLSEAINTSPTESNYASFQYALLAASNQAFNKKDYESAELLAREAIAQRRPHDTRTETLAAKVTLAEILYTRGTIEAELIKSAEITGWLGKKKKEKEKEQKVAELEAKRSEAITGLYSLTNNKSTKDFAAANHLMGILCRKEGHYSGTGNVAGVEVDRGAIDFLQATTQQEGFRVNAYQNLANTLEEYVQNHKFGSTIYLKVIDEAIHNHENFIIILGSSDNYYSGMRADINASLKSLYHLYKLVDSASNKTERDSPKPNFDLTNPAYKSDRRLYQSAIENLRAGHIIKAEKMFEEVAQIQQDHKDFNNQANPDKMWNRRAIASDAYGWIAAINDGSADSTGYIAAKIQAKNLCPYEHDAFLDSDGKKIDHFQDFKKFIKIAANLTYKK